MITCWAVVLIKRFKPGMKSEGVRTQSLSKRTTDIEMHAQYRCTVWDHIDMYACNVWYCMHRTTKSLGMKSEGVRTY